MGMADGMDECWIVLRVGDKELPRVGHKLASCSLLISYVLILEASTKSFDIRIQIVTLVYSVQLTKAGVKMRLSPGMSCCRFQDHSLSMFFYLSTDKAMKTV